MRIASLVAYHHTSHTHGRTSSIICLKATSRQLVLKPRVSSYMTRHEFARCGEVCNAKPDAEAEKHKPHAKSYEGGRGGQDRTCQADHQSITLRKKKKEKKEEVGIKEMQ